MKNTNAFLQTTKVTIQSNSMKNKLLFRLIFVALITFLQISVNAQTFYDNLPDVAEYVLEGRKWNKTDLTYFFSNGTNDISGNTERDIVRQAFQTWANVTSLTFTEVSTQKDTDIVILWGARDHGDGANLNFDGPNGVLAHGFYPPPNVTLAGDCHFDEDETWTTQERSNNNQPIDLLTVAIHEIGHALGLAHSDIAGSIMVKGYTKSQRSLHQDDIRAIQALYPPINLPTWRYSSAGVGSWQNLAKSGAELNGLAFGDFNGDDTTDVFTAFGGRWYVSYGGTSSWQFLARSGVKFENLRFGDFDGDNKTDVFTAINGQWLFSSGGKGSWQNLAQSGVPLENLRFGDFDGDEITDVFTTTGNLWRYSSGGRGGWQNLAKSGAKLNELAFGNFDEDKKTDVFTTINGQWLFSSGGAGGWQNLAKSGVTLENLRFGDFNGDGTTDVFTTTGNLWRYSSGGRGGWQNLARSGAKIQNLRFGDFNGDGTTDVFTIQ